MKKYITKKDTWFDEGTEAKLIDDYSNPPGNFLEDAGLYESYRNGGLDQEICLNEEFKIIYVCDFCTTEESAVWTEKRWILPEFWYQGVDSVNGTQFHACDACRETL